MKFRYYFFKEDSRSYDRAELLTYLEAQPYMMLFTDGAIKTARYNNTTINMTADFVLSTKSIVPNIQRLNPKFLDLNIYVEFDVLNNTYKVNKIVDMIEVICKRFDFAVYNEYFEDVIQFKRSILIKAFELVKNGYKKKYEEEFMNYSRLDKESLDSIYTFLETKEHLVNIEKYKILPYTFLRESETRRCYVAVDLDPNHPFIIPPGAQLVRIPTSDGSYDIVSYTELKAKIEKYLTVVDAKIYDLYIVNEKHYKKVKKIIAKSKLINVKVSLREVPLAQVLDL